MTSTMMSAVKATGNKAEVRLRRELWRRGLRYRLYDRRVLGRPDMVFSRARVVVFVDGDYWHGRAIIEDGVDAFRATMRTERREWWISKLTRNIERDRAVTEGLEAQGWRVVRVWESRVKAELPGLADQVEQIVRSRLPR